MAADWTTGRIRYYKLDETTGTACTDEEGTGDMTLANITFDADSVARSDLPKFNTAISKGATAGERAAESVGLGIANTGKVTYACWCKMGTVQCDLINTKGTTQGGFWFRLWSDGKAYPQRGSSQQTGITVGVFDNAWHHLVLTFDGTANQCQAFVDGAEVVGSPIALNAGANFSSTQPLRLFEAQNGSQAFAAAIDEVMVFNRVLTDEDIAGLAAWDGTSGEDEHGNSRNTAKATALPTARQTAA